MRERKGGKERRDGDKMIVIERQRGKISGRQGEGEEREKPVARREEMEIN